MLHDTTFGYIFPSEEQREKMDKCRQAAKAYADVIETEMPDGPDKTTVLRAHRGNAMWVNVGITRQPDGSPR